ARKNARRISVDCRVAIRWTDTLAPPEWMAPYPLSAPRIQLPLQTFPEDERRLGCGLPAPEESAAGTPGLRSPRRRSRAWVARRHRPRTRRRSIATPRPE